GLRASMRSHQGGATGAAWPSVMRETSPGSEHYAGDTIGDLPSFSVVAELLTRCVPGLLVCASSDEVPEVTEAADLVVAGPAGLAEFLDGLMAKLRAS